MDETLESVCNALEKVANSFSPRLEEKRLLSELYGWNCASLSYQDLANIPLSLAQQIKETQIQEISDELKNTLQDVSRKLQVMQSQQIINHLFSGNAVQAIPAYMGTMTWIEMQISPLLLFREINKTESLIWQSMEDPKALPPHISKNLASLKKQVDEIVINKEELISTIKLIHEAKETAEHLPASLITLKEAHSTIENRLARSEIDSQKVSELKDNSIQHEKSIGEKILEAEKLISQCEEAYQVTTTKGLAGAFEERANKLSWSMWIWVVGFLIALGFGAWIGHQRLDLLTKTMLAKNPDTNIIIIQTILSALSLGAPIWFAWVASKQIGYRFRLAEDYAFKASVAKAYEGYRKAAANFDETFAARLFSSALTRVEEPPLRLIEKNNHASPLHELINSSSSLEFQKAMNNLPTEIKDKFFELAKYAIDATKEVVKSQKDTPEQSEDKS